MSSEVEIREVVSRGDLKKFVRFATWLYEGNSLYVHPLEVDEMRLFSRRNPSWAQVDVKLFLALRGGEVVGRIGVIIQHKYNEKVGGKFARFTRFDFIDDVAVSKALLDCAFDYARAMGMEKVHGPLGFNDLDREGLLVEGFDRLSTFEESYNYAYYKQHLEQYGFSKEADWVEFVLHISDQPNAKIEKIHNHVMKRNDLHFLPEKMSIRKALAKYSDRFFEIINDSYSRLHGFVPLTKEVQDSVLAQFKKIIRREWVCLVFNSKDEVVGITIVMPNISRSVNRSRGRLLPFGWFRILREARNPRHMDMALIAVVDEYRGKGINAIMINQIHKNLVKNKIVSIESNLELETNASVLNQFDGYDREFVKRRRCFVKEV